MSIPVAVMIFAVNTATISVVMMAMMVASCVRIIRQRSGSESLCRHIRRSLNTCIQFDSRVVQSHLSAHSDAATNEGVHLGRLQETGQRAVSAAVRVHNLLADDLSVLSVVKLELLAMAEMLENLSVFVCYRDPHGITSFLHRIRRDLNLIFPLVPMGLEHNGFMKRLCSQDLYTSKYQAVCVLMDQKLTNRKRGNENEISKARIMQERNCIVKPSDALICTRFCTNCSLILQNI